jgi:hypothetical protein
MILVAALLLCERLWAGDLEVKGSCELCLRSSDSPLSTTNKTLRVELESLESLKAAFLPNAAAHHHGLARRGDRDDIPLHPSMIGSPAILLTVLAYRSMPTDIADMGFGYETGL